MRPRGYDPIRMEIFKSLYASAAEEMGVTLRRTAFSPNIKERRDYSCAVFDARGRTGGPGGSHARAPRLDADVGACCRSGGSHGAGRHRNPQRPLRRGHPPAGHHPRQPGLCGNRAKAQAALLCCQSRSSFRCRRHDPGLDAAEHGDLPGGPADSPDQAVCRRQAFRGDLPACCWPMSGLPGSAKATSRRRSQPTAPGRGACCTSSVGTERAKPPPMPGTSRITRKRWFEPSSGACRKEHTPRRIASTMTASMPAP